MAAVRLFSHRRRPVHLGPFPLERLLRADALPALTAAGVPSLDSVLFDSRGLDSVRTARSVVPAMRAYFDLFRATRDGAVAPARAPVLDEAGARAAERRKP